MKWKWFVNAVWGIRDLINLDTGSHRDWIRIDPLQIRVSCVATPSLFLHINFPNRNWSELQWIVDEDAIDQWEKRDIYPRPLHLLLIDAALLIKYLIFSSLASFIIHFRHIHSSWEIQKLFICLLSATLRSFLSSSHPIFISNLDLRFIISLYQFFQQSSFFWVSPHSFIFLSSPAFSISSIKWSILLYGPKMSAIDLTLRKFAWSLFQNVDIQI